MSIAPDARVGSPTTEILMTIPLYASDLSFEGYIPARLARRMEQAGVAQLVRQRGGVRKGAIRRAVMCRRPGDPKPPSCATTWARRIPIASNWTTAIVFGRCAGWAGHVTPGDHRHEYHLAAAAAVAVFIPRDTLVHVSMERP